MKNIWNTLENISSQAAATKKVSAEVPPNVPRRQISKDPVPDHLSIVRDKLAFYDPGWEFDVIPVIRKLVRSNADMSQAFKDVIQLANTGHQIKIAGVDQKQHLEITKLIYEESNTWCEGTAGLHGIINKMFSQLLVGGAISNEWVPNNKLTGLERLKFVNPEQIRYARKKGQTKYTPYQKVESANGLFGKSRVDPIRGQYVKLNTSTYRYYGLLGDTDLPYGVPPYLATITPVSTQTRMLENIDQITSTMGILGWAEALMDKPDMISGESEEKYRARLTQILVDLKCRVEENMRTGVSVGFKNDHEFNFQSTVSDASGMESLWQNNEQQLASALDFDSAFMGRGYSSSETMVSILFTKMISQLTNIQEVVEHNLEYGITLFLRLKGYKFDSVKIEFNKSTITDDLKYQQAQEIKLRNLVVLYKMGTIDEFMFAQLSGFDKPVMDEPRVPIENVSGGGGAKSPDEAKDKEDKEKGKDKSDRKSKEKGKQGPVRKTKPVTNN